MAGKKQIVDGIKFDSGLEVQIYRRLKMKGLKFIVHPKSFELQKGYTSWAVMKGGKVGRSKIRNISYTTDFQLYLDNGNSVYIEAKGYWRVNDASKIRWKMFHSQLKPGDFGFVVKTLQDLEGVLTFVKAVNETSKIPPSAGLIL